MKFILDSSQMSIHCLTHPISHLRWCFQVKSHINAGNQDAVKRSVSCLTYRVTLVPIYLTLSTSKWRVSERERDINHYPPPQPTSTPPPATSPRPLVRINVFSPLENYWWISWPIPHLANPRLIASHGWYVRRESFDILLLVLLSRCEI